jgi:DNA primase
MPFERESLPYPEYYYVDQLEKFKPGTKGNASAICPFHDDKHPSLTVNLHTGAYRCYSCGASGGDVLAFHRARYYMDFKAAAQDLGAWR